MFPDGSMFGVEGGNEFKLDLNPDDPIAKISYDKNPIHDIWAEMFGQLTFTTKELVSNKKIKLKIFSKYL